jgi:Arc/MetJ family transcription regulator
MRTTLDIPDDLLEEARSMLGFKSKTDTVVVALRELVRRGRLEEIKELYGKLDVTVNLPRSRRRTGKRG